MGWLISIGVYLISCVLSYVGIRYNILNEHDAPTMQAVCVVFTPVINTIIAVALLDEIFIYKSKGEFAKKFFRL